jgi:single-stranded-DNA-specific exonuclease
MAEWLDLPIETVPEQLQQAVGGHALVAMTLARRGYRTPRAARGFLNPDEYEPAPPSDLPGLASGAQRLERGIAAGEEICVWGDFDVDGQTATTVLVSTLRDLGGSVRYYIPSRDRGSHGFHKPILEQLIEDGVELVVTCDTGVRGHDAVDYAASQGVDVVITDHHDLPDPLPRAHAVVNPKMLDVDHPLRELPGVGCAWQLARALYDGAGRGGEAARHLDLVALGAVADVAVLTGDTRYLVQRGLEVLRETERLGLRVMMDMAEVAAQTVTEEHIGFVLAPRLNSLGRLADATVGVEFLSTDDLARARVLATEMEGLNARRKLLCDQVERAAVSQVEREPALLDHAVLVLAGESWPAGVIGVVAGRLARRYSRPVVLFTTGSSGPARGSARSVEGCDISAAIGAQAEMLISFGGHPMAAGLSIEAERIPVFRSALWRTVEKMWDQVEGLPAVRIDARLPLRDVTLDVVQELERLAPFGAGNPPLTLACSSMVVAGQRAVGRNQEHLLLTAEDEAGERYELIWWDGSGEEVPADRFDLAYTARSSDFRGERRVQLEWIDARPTAEAAGAVLARPRVAAVTDCRKESRPHEALARLLAEEGVQIWSEASHKAEVGGRDRQQLEPAPTLVIWTTPPGPAELAAALERVNPEELYLFAKDPGVDRAEVFLKRLVGLAKHSLAQKDGLASVAALAAATGQREATVRAGLSWLVARGDIAVSDQEEDLVRLVEERGEANRAEVDKGAQRVRELLAETAAYRSHFATAEPERLI